MLGSYKMPARGCNGISWTKLLCGHMAVVRMLGHEWKGSGDRGNPKGETATRCLNGLEQV